MDTLGCPDPQVKGDPLRQCWGCGEPRPEVESYPDFWGPDKPEHLCPACAEEYEANLSERLDYWAEEEIEPRTRQEAWDDWYASRVEEAVQDRLAEERGAA